MIKHETGDENVFRYGGKDYQRELALLGISHGRDAPWLRRQLIDGGPEDRFFQPVATGESANLAFPGLLLRLADVMDFDASRAPHILFKHFGIENDKSVLEWNKHSSVIGWRLDVDPDGKQQPDLLYSAECDHPVHEKSIRELLQNALDAVELRELRLKMKQIGEVREPVDGELIRPGWVREPDGREEELRVTLDWGHRRGDRPTVAARHGQRGRHD